MKTNRIGSQEARGNSKSYVAVFFFVALFIIAGYSLRESNKARQAQVVDSVNAGHLVKAVFIPSTFSSDNTKIETDKDTYLVYGKLQVENGTSFRLEKRLNKQKFLCETLKNECWKLVF